MVMFDVLAKNGYDVRLFCDTHSIKHAAISHLTGIKRFLKSPADILIYHHSRGWPPGVQLVRELGCRRVIRYHNVTPGSFFERFSRTDQELCETGRKELTELVRAKCDLYLSASAFSMHELIAIGADASRSYVVAPFHQIDRLGNITADKRTIEKHSDGNANILSVGRVVPHKSLHDLIEVFANYHFEYNRTSRLIIVGKGGEGLSPYSKALHHAVQRLGLSGSVVFTGGVSEEVLKAHYQVADAFVTVSQHEGFCVPLVEAMAMKLPITAYALTAIPETLGDAGLVWTEQNPMLVAGSLDLLVRDASVRSALGRRGRRRYEAMFTNEKIERRFLDAISKLR